MRFLFPCPAGTPPSSFDKDSRTCLLPGCLPPHISDSGTVTASLYPCRTTYPQTYGKDAVRDGGSPLATRHHTNKCERTGPVSISYCKAGRPPVPPSVWETALLRLALPSVAAAKAGRLIVREEHAPHPCQQGGCKRNKAKRHEKSAHPSRDGRLFFRTAGRGLRC